MSIFDPLGKNVFRHKASDKYRVLQNKYVNIPNTGRVVYEEDKEYAYEYFINNIFPRLTPTYTLYDLTLTYIQNIPWDSNYIDIPLLNLIQQAENAFQFPQTQYLLNWTFDFRVNSMSIESAFQISGSPQVGSDALKLEVYSDWLNNLTPGGTPVISNLYVDFSNVVVGTPISYQACFAEFSGDLDISANASCDVPAYLFQPRTSIISPDLGGSLGWNYKMSGVKTDCQHELINKDPTLLHFYAIPIGNLVRDTSYQSCLQINYTIKIVAQDPLQKPDPL